MFNKTKQDIIFISLLKLGEEKGLEGLGDEELRQWAHKNKIFSSSENERYEWPRLHYLFKECFARPPSSHPNRILKNEYYFRLIEYRELQEARKTSKQANRNSWIAIGLSTLAIIITSILAWTQINSPIRLHEDSIKQIVEEIK